MARAEQTVRFGVFEVDLRSGELRRAGVRIKLQEQPFKVLIALLERPGEVVSRDELRHRIWPEEGFGDFDHAVNIAIAKLRTALSDSAETPRLIETLHRRGYRFIFPVAGTDFGGQATPESASASASGAGANGSRTNVTTGKEAAAETAAATSARSRWIWISAVSVLVLGVGGTSLWLSRSLPPPRVLSTAQITHDGLTKTGVLNDGSRLYITETTGSKQSLVQVSCAGGDTLVIPTPFANIVMSDISGDHSQMLVADAVGTANEGQVWVLPLPAGAPRRLGDIVARWDTWSSQGWATWSPDGRAIAFARGSEIYKASADGTDVQKLITLSGYASEMRFSTDGSRLRFTLRSVQNNAASSIWEIRADGTDLHPVLPGWHSSFSEMSGDWTRDGRYYFFTSTDDTNRASIWAIREPAGLFHRRPSPPVELTTGPMSVFFNGTSSDGTKIFAGGWSSRSELVRYEPRSREFAPFLGGISADQLDFSPDSKWVVYVSEPQRTLWRSRVDGSERLQLTSSSVSALLPRWSPDGTQIAYVDEQAGAFWKIFLISAQGGTPQPLLSENQHQLDPSWSPDGKQIVFGRVPWLKESAEKTSIQILDLDSKQVSTIPGSENLFGPRWSPDGQHLAAVTEGSKKLLLFDFQTRNWTLWIDEPGAVGYPTWSRDGRYIYYDNTSTKSPGYRRVKVGKTRSESLIDLKGLHRGTDPATLLGPWSGLAPDGSALFGRNLSSDEIYSLEVELP